jgi:hypothetical protein
MTSPAWQVGMCVRLVKPDNAKHPRAGQVGEVVEATPYRTGWFLRVRFRRASRDGWSEMKTLDETFGLFDHEVEVTEQP